MDIQTRDQVLSFLLQQCDLKQRTIEEYQKRIAELEKKLSSEAAQEKPPSQS